MKGLLQEERIRDLGPFTLKDLRKAVFVTYGQFGRVYFRMAVCAT